MKHLCRADCTIYNYTAYRKAIMHHKLYLYAQIIYFAHKINFKRRYTRIGVIKTTKAYWLYGIIRSIRRFMDGYFRPYNDIQTCNADNIRSTRQHITQQPEILKSNRRNNAFACQIERTYNLIGAYNISRETCGARYILYTPLKQQCRNITSMAGIPCFTGILPKCCRTVQIHSTKAMYVTHFICNTHRIYRVNYYFITL